MGAPSARVSCHVNRMESDLRNQEKDVREDGVWGPEWQCPTCTVLVPGIRPQSSGRIEGARQSAHPLASRRTTQSLAGAWKAGGWPAGAGRPFSRSLPGLQAGRWSAEGAGPPEVGPPPSGGLHPPRCFSAGGDAPRALCPGKREQTSPIRLSSW